MAKLHVLLLLLSIALAGVSTTSAAAPGTNCEQLGFTGDQKCSDCELMGEMVKDDELVADCQKCCVKDPQSVKYNSATLEVCQYRLQGLPQIKDFIDKKAKSFKQLTVRYSSGMYPRIKLSSAGVPSETIRIDNWKVNTIEEFLELRLNKA